LEFLHVLQILALAIRCRGVTELPVGFGFDQAVAEELANAPEPGATITLGADGMSLRLRVALTDPLLKQHWDLRDERLFLRGPAWKARLLFAGMPHAEWYDDAAARIIARVEAAELEAAEDMRTVYTRFAMGAS